jgi:hypothetical protein
MSGQFQDLESGGGRNARFGWGCEGAAVQSSGQQGHGGAPLSRSGKKQVADLYVVFVFGRGAPDPF